MNKLKKLLAFALVTVLIFTVIPFTAGAAETVTMGYIFETGVNLRKDATTSSDPVEKLSELTVTVTDSKKDTTGVINPETEDTFIWYKISHTSQGKTVKGYIREDLITVTEYTLDESFAQKLKDFPKSYHDDLILLHAMYPKWEFVADKVPNTFKEAVAAQDNGFTKLIMSGPNSWRSMRSGCYNWEKEKFIATDGGRYGASTQVISYYMDPRNFLNANDIYVFMQQSFDENTQTKDGVKEIIDGTFLDAKITNKKDKYYKKSYAYVIMKAAEESKVNPYVLASTLIQEQGTKGSTLSKGAEYKDTTVYNFFNYGASGSTKEEVIKNGKKYAYNQGWTTPSESIISGAKKYGSGYINAGQDTYYYKNFNILDPEKLYHQYAQNVADSLNSSLKLKSAYAKQKKVKVTFRIPVFEELPDSVSKLPKESEKLNNYYFKDIQANGLTPSFNVYTTKYSLTVKSDSNIYFELPDGATYAGEKNFILKKGENKVKLKVKSQTGYSNTYTINVTAAKDCVLYVNPLGGRLEKGQDGKWYYYISNQRVNDTTLVKYNNKWFYVKNGVWAKTANTLVKYNNKWFYVKNGKWSTKTTTLLKYKDKWLYIKNGKWSTETTTLLKHKEKWFYIKNGKWANTETTLVKYEGKWFYVKNGKWEKDKLIFTYKNKKFYIKSGIAQLDFTGKVKISGKKYKIKNGKVV